MSAPSTAEQTVLAAPGADLAVRRWPVAQTGVVAGAAAARVDGARALICLHETGATSASWAALAKHLTAGDPSAPGEARPAAAAEGGGGGAAPAGPAELVAFDRRGWGGSTAPEPYTRTTVAEQAQDALFVMAELGIERAILCGAGLGAVAAIELALREPVRVEAVIAIEPPLLALVEGATEGLSADAKKLREAFEEDGRSAAVELFLAGELPYMAPGSGRLAARELGGAGDGLEARRRPGSLFAEFGAVPAWSLPFNDLAEATFPLHLVIGAESPNPLRAAAEALIPYAPSAQHHRLPAPDPLLSPALAHLPHSF